MKRPHQSSSCQHVQLAHSKVGEVMICPDCGIVHVSLQYVSMRFELDAFRSLADMLGDAQHLIDHLGHGLAQSGERGEASPDLPPAEKIH
ncbi:hypothetical protein [Undibacterium sp. TJN19]|uniref:hypothetical protein n=1 Tax=Undibacterium sp. TJN19 TaxID=3413055 RepID=UPI003BEF8CCF